MKKNVLTLCAILFCTLTAFAQETFIDYGDTWLYYDNAIEPPNDSDGNSWQQQSYQSIGWKTGAGELGYGDGDEATVINNSAYTVYFRRFFNVTDASSFGNISLDLLYDDGAVVYLNGEEVWRVNMPEGDISYDTFAATNPGDNAQANTSIPASLLQNGINVIAVEVHQRSANSSDLSFDFKLHGIPLGTTADVLIGFNSMWQYYDQTNAPPNNANGTTWQSDNYQDTDWSTGVAQLGYGDDDEATLITSGVYAAYFRHTFNVPDASLYDYLELNLLFDDGGVVYLNGEEIWRVNMPAGNIGYDTFANSGLGDNAEMNTTIQSNLKNGTNVIAVEIHQDDNTSSDISFDFELVGIPPGFVEVSRGPYLQKASPSDMTIRWRTDLPIGSGVRYGTDMNNLDQVSTTAIGTEHEVELTNLTPATVYYYEILNGSTAMLSAAEDLYFKTHPQPGTDSPLTAWILGDCGTANADQRNVRDAYYDYIGDKHTDMMLFLGDNAYNIGTDVQYQNSIFENMYEDKLKNTVSWSCLGNHDGLSANSNTQQGPYYEIFNFPKNGESGGLPSGTEAYFSFDYGNVHFISLDSYESDKSVGGPMYTWCENDIQNTTADWIVALWHHPPYTKGSHNSDSEAALIQMRQNFLPMLEDNGIDLVLNGHSHSYERSYFINGHYSNSSTFDPSTHIVQTGNGRENQDGHYDKFTNGNIADKGAVYIVTGSAGKITGNGALNHNAMYYSAKSLGSTVMDVHGDTMRIKFLRETGAINDYFTMIKNTIDCTAGQPCNDNDPCTTNDIYSAECTCSGTPPLSPNVDAGQDMTSCSGEFILTATVSSPDNNLNYEWEVYDDTNTLINTLTGNNIPITIIGNSQINLTVSNTFGCPVGNDQVIYTLEGDSDNDGICDLEDPCDNNTNGNSCNDNIYYTVNDAFQDCECIGCYQLDLKIQLEGAYDTSNQSMNSQLYLRNLLPGQINNLPIGTSTPPGQPYNTAPWNYSGTEAIDWAAADYTPDMVDWVLVSFRTGIEKNTQFAQTLGILHTDGRIMFPDRCVLDVTHPTTMYVVIEHRNHMGVMSPQPITISTGFLRHNFTLIDSYRDATSFGQKQLPTGRWVMFAGDIDASDMPSYDVNAGDKASWIETNGVFNNYLPTDVNLDGDINGADKAIWEGNNGISSRVPK